MTEQELNQNPDEQNESPETNSENTASQQGSAAEPHQEESQPAVNQQQQESPEPAPSPAEPVAEEQASGNSDGALQEDTSSASGDAQPAATESANTDAPASEQNAQPAAETADTNAPATEQDAATGEEKSKRKASQEARSNAFTEVFAELQEAKNNNTPVEVEIRARIKGGLRAFYKGMPLFLPASHFSLKRAPREEELTEAVGTRAMVHVHEVQQDEQGRKTAIVTRRSLSNNDFWGTINVGDIIEGRVSSVAPFGVFVDLGGIEGLIHVSRLSHRRIENPADEVKKGDVIRAVVVEVNKEKRRIGLSRKELEESPWINTANDYPAGSTVKGIVKRLTNFGAYVEVRPGVEGLLRTSELSWAQRMSHPGDLLTEGQEIEAHVLSVSEEQRTLALSLKKLQENPWTGIAERFPQGTEVTGTVKHVAPQGAIISIGEDVDGFLPRSKMFSEGNKAPFKKGDQLQVIIADVVPQEESLILSVIAPEGAQQQQYTPQSGNEQRGGGQYGGEQRGGGQYGGGGGQFGGGGDRRQQGGGQFGGSGGGDRRSSQGGRPGGGSGERRDRKPKDGPREQRDPVRIILPAQKSESTSFSFLDLLSEDERNALMNNSENQ
ncbi:MAG: S1 RNA-binding domain-containing protein [Bacteroidota bacterium]